MASWSLRRPAEELHQLGATALASRAADQHRCIPDVLCSHISSSGYESHNECYAMTDGIDCELSEAQEWGKHQFHVNTVTADRESQQQGPGELSQRCMGAVKQGSMKRRTLSW